MFKKAAKRAVSFVIAFVTAFVSTVGMMPPKDIKTAVAYHGNADLAYAKNIGTMNRDGKEDPF